MKRSLFRSPLNCRVGYIRVADTRREGCYSNGRLIPSHVPLRILYNLEKSAGQIQYIAARLTLVDPVSPLSKPADSTQSSLMIRDLTKSIARLTPGGQDLAIAGPAHMSPQPLAEAEGGPLGWHSFPLVEPTAMMDSKLR